MSPVPKSKKKAYGSAVAAITAILKRKGMSPGAANKRAKKDADRTVLHEGYKKAKAKKRRK